ncbi:hypothetical protein GCM10007063_21120 [Lentibacillus kapialis]|uniref:DUF948 domain-containing protein n=1 Tax=Lentibacillus kapialis TaxID=340214 RepID=A0A917PXA8_9BACI|nr:DUF948 domain-containing protein [Lentibacillus kapialis]GGJ98589.1 hypothetical protein GCM10007063_21120 [Lentibacillus kapialis]
MDWVGIGVIIIGLALLGLVFLLIKPLQNLTKVLAGVQKTTDNLPNQVADMITDLKTALSSANDTVKHLNEQLGKLAPIFQIIGNIGKSLEHLFNSMAKINDDMKHKTDNAMMERYHLEGIYGVMALGYGLYQKNKANK